MIANLETNIEVGSLARLLAESVGHEIAFRERELGLTKQEAHDQVMQAMAPAQVERLSSTPVAQISWVALSRLIQADAEHGLAVWERIKQEARQELASGHRAAAALDFDSSPWTRARFAALRESFYSGWQPRDGVERALVDLLAQLYSEQLTWLERYHQLSTGMAMVTRRELEQRGSCEPPRVDAAEAVQEAAGMLDRFNKLFLRTLRSLRDLRRWSTPVTINNSGGQLNIGAQVNAAQIKAEEPYE